MALSGTRSGHSCTWSTTNSTWNDLGSKPLLRSEVPATSHVRRGTVQNNFTLFQEHSEMAPLQLPPQNFGFCHVVVIDGRVFMK